MTSVQIAIQDRTYAEALRQLLLADGEHRVYIAKVPSTAIEGVVVTDETVMRRMNLPDEIGCNRCVVFATKAGLEADRLWAAGIRHVIHCDYPPETGQLVILAAESALQSKSSPRQSIAKQADRAYQIVDDLERPWQV